MDEDKSIQTVPSDNQALSAVQNTGGKLASLPAPEILKKQLERTIEYRVMIGSHIKSTFIKDVHYYKYHFYKECRIYKCQDSRHLSNKWEITAEGAKKLTADFLLFPDFKIDEETRNTFGDPMGLICLICFLYTIDSKFFASGRGNSRVGSYNDENKATKMAQKSALIDALKSSGLLSDFENTIAEKEGEVIKIEIKETTKPTKAETAGGKNGWCEYCPSPGPYHSRVCPQFVEPKPLEGEIV